MVIAIRYLMLTAVLAGILILTQCRSDGSGSGNNRQQTDAETILSARTLGLAYLEENKLEEAELEFRKLVSLLPGESIGYANLGLVYLRMGNYGDAEQNLIRALELTPQDPDIRLNLATVYKYQNRNEQFVLELEKAIEADPGHLASVYRLAEYYGGTTDQATLRTRELYLRRALEISPANIVPRLHLIEVQLHLEKLQEALLNLEEITRIFPDYSEEAKEYYNQAFDAVRAGKRDEALTAVLIFHNFLKLTNPYSQGITALKGFEGTAAGSPMFTFSDAAPLFLADGESILDAIRFTDVTESAGLGIYSPAPGGTGDPARSAATHIAMGDFDHNGTEDIYLGTYLPGQQEYGHFMLKSEMGRFSDVAGSYGLKQKGEESFACFTDYDNDGWFDLFVISQGEPLLYKSVSAGQYEDVTGKAFSGDPGKMNAGLYFDMDHEGDLDLLAISGRDNRLFRNNADGTFTDYSESSGLMDQRSGSADACFGDFDDDGDIDLVAVNGEGSCDLFTNIREGRFRSITASAGLGNISGMTMVKAGDYNNDGFLDLFFAGPGTATYTWARNTGKGTFDLEKIPGMPADLREGFITHDAEFCDFDNDGHLDMIIAGDPGSEAVPGVILLHNEGSGRFADVSRLLPDPCPGGRQIEVADYNEDGDMDIFLAGLHGGVRLLRNDGGNANHHLKVRLIGVRAGSGKNNYYGIGAKVELRAGNLYQMKVVTGPNVYFGLGDRSDVDVVRILWTNGTPQNIFTPGIEQALIEEQQLKGSCPFLYAWNGSEYVFIKDIMWRSALGMPMGIMGEEQTYAFAEASRDYHKIPGNMLKPLDGKYSLQLTEELWETIYLDEVQLVVVDHPDSVEIYVDEKFVPPPYPPLKIHPVSRSIEPLSAQDGYGNDVTEQLRNKDDMYVSGFKKERYQGITEMRTLVIDPGKLEQTDRMFLFLNGWIFPTDASINLALSQGDHLKVVAPCLQVMNQEGAWVTVIDNIGFPQGKDKTIIADLSGKYLTGDHRVRICTNMEIYWDRAFFSATSSEVPLQTVRLRPSGADHHYRGFSRMFRKGGPYGPHWFDYGTVTQAPKWRDLQGTYTRYGDVVELLQHPDNQYIIANAGDETTIEFDATGLKEPPEGWTRDFLIYSAGWVKDGDMNTAEGHRVEPLPFHGMDRYPYDSSETYPDNREIRRYHKKYNTREVTAERFRRSLFEMQ